MERRCRYTKECEEHMRLGILGGTFNPIHNLHLKTAQIAYDELHLDELCFMPTGDSPHKKVTTPARHRLKMVRLAIEGHPGFTVSDMEIKRAGRSYTYDTLSQIRRERGDIDLFFIVGADMLVDLPHWRNPAGILELAVIGAVPREGVPEEKFLSVCEQLRREYGARIEILSPSGSPLSSTEIREKARQHEDISDAVPEAVADYIRRQTLYGLSNSEITAILERELDPKRFRHTLGVAQTAEQLARQNGVSTEKAVLAALLHDNCKCMNYPDMRKRALEAGLSLDCEELQSSALLHAPLGAYLAQHRFGICENDVINAIRYHTTGRAEMTPLDAIVYLADMIEPYRKPFEGLEELRQIAAVDLYRAYAAALDQCNGYVLDRGQRLYDRSRLAAEWVHAYLDARDSGDSAANEGGTKE